jgi:hypothetical protein
VFLKVLQLAEDRAEGKHTVAQMNSVGEESDKLYDELFPGNEAPTAKALALAAVGDAAFTDDPITTAVETSGLAATAIATAAAELAANNQYDATFDETLERETVAQAEMLKEVCERYA